MQKQQDEQLSCGDCWWFALYVNNKTKGQCFQHGFSINKDNCICCDFDRGA